ncbi:MAG: lipopolysaccharide transport periplasmic protein LptA [Salaquimonas sp.]|nr:lipopolysaccharide transport periplasmic protein LptA [Salaquimonas sp.]
MASAGPVRVVCDAFFPRAVMVALVLMMFAAPAPAQNFGGAFEGMRDTDAPVEIEADRLEVVDKQGLAVFEGNVSVVQGSTLLKTKRLTVRYVSGKGAAGPGGNIRTIEASGRVAVRSKDQTASADKAIVDMEKQMATLSGNVSISQGKNIVTGCVLTINLATNAATLQPCSSNSGRVKMLFTPKSGGGQ